MIEPRCENCVRFAQARVCEAGRCRRVDVDNQTLVQVQFEGNGLTETARGYVEVLMTSITADGRRVSCQELLSTCDWRDPSLSVFNSNFGGGGPFARGRVWEIFTDSTEADDLIFFFIATEEGAGRGDIRTIGCVDGFDVEFGRVNQVPDRIVLLDEWP